MASLNEIVEAVMSYFATSTADENAIALLRDNLTRAQRREFDKTNRFCVTGNFTGRTYQIKAGTMQNVWLLDEESGSKVQGVCFGPTGLSLAGDIMLCQKIGLECMEKEVLEVGVVFDSSYMMHDVDYSHVVNVYADG